MSTQPDQTKPFFGNTAFMLEESVKQITAEGRAYIAELREQRERRDLIAAQHSVHVDIDLSDLELRVAATQVSLNNGVMVWTGSWPGTFPSPTGRLK